MKYKYLILIYVFLTFIKLFTASIDKQREEDPTLILKLTPTIQNVFHGSDEAIETYTETHNWYKEHKYCEIIHFGSVGLLRIYEFIIYFWWFVTFLGIIYVFYQSQSARRR